MVAFFRKSFEKCFLKNNQDSYFWELSEKNEKYFKKSVLFWIFSENFWFFINFIKKSHFSRFVNLCLYDKIEKNCISKAIRAVFSPIFFVSHLFSFLIFNFFLLFQPKAYATKTIEKLMSFLWLFIEKPKNAISKF